MLKKNRWLLLALPIVGMGMATAADFTLSSPDVKEGENIPVKYLANDFGCTGKNIQPVLSWSNPPEGTKGYAITFFDKDADTGSGFWHWVAIDIPQKVTTLNGKTMPAGMVVKANDTGKKQYLGPCPPLGEAHTYSYTIHALDTAKLEAPANSTAPLTGYFINKHTIAKASLNLRVSRSQ